jgi:hypothetical protein
MIISHLPETSRVWFFGANQPITSEQKERLEPQLQEFVQNWKAHGAALTAGFEFVHDVALIVAIDESKTPPSGCSIDKIFKLLADSEIDFMQRTLTWQPFCNTAKTYKSIEIASAIQNGELTPESLVLNPQIITLREAREHLYIPLKESWIGLKMGLN